MKKKLIDTSKGLQQKTKNKKMICNKVIKEIEILHKKCNSDKKDYLKLRRENLSYFKIQR